MNKILGKYGYTPDEEQIVRSLEMIAGQIDSVKSPEVLKKCFSIMDLTTLHTQDTVASVQKLVDKVNALPETWPGYPLPASVCVFPNFASTVAARRADKRLHVTTVAGCFPSSQSWLEVKVQECRLAVANGADEIDIVLALSHFMAGEYEAAAEEISAMKEAAVQEAARCGRQLVFKVILETGLLGSAENIATASLLAMEAGADFIKTSTGKVGVNATPMAAYVMCEAIRRFYEVTGRKVGFKAAGGISTAEDALCYYSIAATVLGEQWLCPELLRLGVSRLGNSLMSAIEGGKVVYF